MWFFYNLVFPVVYLAMLPKFLRRMKKRGGYRAHFTERFGVYDDNTLARLSERRRLWIHAVSVGEVNVAETLIAELRALDPSLRVVLSTTTSTGHERATRVAGAGDVVLYFPVDMPIFVERALRVIRPLGIVLTECELWPNLIRRSTDAATPVFLFNGRLSASSFAAYRRVRAFTRLVLPRLHTVMAQTEADAARFRELGATNVATVGSAKYDGAALAPPDTSAAMESLAACGLHQSAFLIVGGSTWRGEEQMLVRIRERLERETGKSVGLVLAPRHMERRDEIAAELTALGARFALKTRLAQPVEADILVADTTGELRSFYTCADAVFVGKSMAGHTQGQNMIEPAGLGKPVVVGNGVSNFENVAHELADEQAIRLVPDEESLYAVFLEWMRDESARKTVAANAADSVRRRRGAGARSALIIMEALRKAGNSTK